MANYSNSFVNFDPGPENIKVLYANQGLYDDRDFDNLQKLRELKLSFNKLPKKYFIYADDLSKIGEFGNDEIYLRIVIESPNNPKDKLFYENIVMQTSSDSSSAPNSPKTSKLFKMSDSSLDAFKSNSSGDLSSPRDRKSKKKSRRLSRKLDATEISCGQLDILPRIYNEMLADVRNDDKISAEELGINNLYRKNITLVDNHNLFYFKNESKYTIFVCQRKDENLFLRGTYESQVSGAELSSYSNAEIKYKDNTFNIFASKLTTVSFPIYILIGNKSQSVDFIAKKFEMIVQLALKQYK